MIGSVSNYTSYTSTSSTSTNSARSQQFQKDLLAKLDSNSDGAVDQDELKTALQAGREQNTDSSTHQFNVTEALNKMNANLSKQYSLDNVATVGKYLNEAT